MHFLALFSNDRIDMFPAEQNRQESRKFAVQEGIMPYPRYYIGWKQMPPGKRRLFV